MASARVLRLAGAAALVATALPAAAPTASASFPGDNGSIFVVAQEGSDRRIDRYNTNGTFGGGAGGNATESSNVASSADGSRLAYSKSGNVVLVDLETFTETPIASSTANEIDPAFSFDGRYLLYVSDADGDQEIYMKDLTTSTDPTQLTDNAVDDWAPAWGRAVGGPGTGHSDLIAYVSLDGGDPEIFTMTPGGTGNTNLTNNTVPDFGPNWHPGFNVLAYSSHDAQGRDQIMTMSYDGTDKTQITSDAAFNHEPAWSPDGTTIAFTKQGTAPGSPGRIYLRPGTPGGTETPLTPADDTSYDRAEWQSFPGECQEDCGPGEITPTLFMNLSRHVVVSGGVEGSGDTTGGICGVGTPIQIQRYSNGRFRTIANVATNANGTFRKQVPDKTGRYRLRSLAFTDQETGTECLPATGPTRSHRHR